MRTSLLVCLLVPVVILFALPELSMMRGLTVSGLCMAMAANVEIALEAEFASKIQESLERV